MSERVLILGASPKPHRFAYKAMRKLTGFGHDVVLVANRRGNIEGREVYLLDDLVGSPAGELIDTLTLYVNPQRLAPMMPQLLQLKPRRVICNPGTESNELAVVFEEAGVEVVNDCTLIMLDEGSF